MRSLLLLLVLALGAGCPARSSGDDDDVTDDDDSADDDDSTGDDDDSTGDDDDSTPFDASALHSAGPVVAESSSIGFATSTGCILDATLFEPSGGGPLVVLAHGFQRSAAEMQGLAEHLASWGFRVVTPDLCHSSFLDSDPVANAAEMRELAADLAPGEPVGWVGHSAGGLAALIAASDDPQAGVLVGLDLVDNGPGPDAAAAISAPVYGIFGEPGACNSDGNGVAVLSAASAASLGRVTEADHCDFEDPTGPLCTAICQGSNDQFDDAEITAAVRGLMTAALLGELVDGDALDWWSGDLGAALQADGLWSPIP